jgi:anthranilate/para-aminobenzoate synthase component I
MDTINPSKKEFFDSASRGTMLPVYAQMNTPGLTPIAVLQTLRREGSGHAVLLESARLHEQTGRYSFVTAEPYLVFRSRGDEIELNLPETPTGKFGKRAVMKRKPLAKLRDLLSNYKTGHVPGLPPFTGGAVGFFSYDFARQFTALPAVVSVDPVIPESYFIFVDMVVAFDHILNRSWMIVNPGAREQELGFRRVDPNQWDRYYDDAVERLKACSARLTSVTGKPDPLFSSEHVGQKIDLTPGCSSGEFESMVRRCKERITAGDIFRMHLSQCFSTVIGDQDPFHLYQFLHEIIPSPFAAYLDFGDMQLVSSSPEQLISFHGGIPGIDCLELFQTRFPAEMVTGTPKERCMNIIDKLEPVARGPYAGSLGYLSNSGNMDFNVIVRTFTVRDGTASFPIGSIITADSDPAQEYAELLQKAESLVMTLDRP